MAAVTGTPASGSAYTAGPPIFKIDPRELGSNEWGTQRPEGPDKWSTSVPIYSKDGEWQRGPSGEIGGGIGDGALGASGTAGYHLGPSATAGVDVGFKDGNLHAGAEAEAKFGLSANAAGEAHLGDLKAAAAASAFVGGVAGVTSGLDIGRDGLSADVGGEAFVGGEAKLKGTSYGGVGVGGTRSPMASEQDSKDTQTSGGTRYLRRQRKPDSRIGRSAASLPLSRRRSITSVTVVRRLPRRSVRSSDLAIDQTILTTTGE